jgi:hypothetical protein
LVTLCADYSLARQLICSDAERFSPTQASFDGWLSTRVARNIAIAKALRPATVRGLSLQILNVLLGDTGMKKPRL